jgi:hypothetical protein
MTLTEINQSTQKKIYPSATSHTTNLDMNWSGLELVPPLRKTGTIPSAPLHGVFVMILVVFLVAQLSIFLKQGSLFGQRIYLWYQVTVLRWQCCAPTEYRFPYWIQLPLAWARIEIHFPETFVILTARGISTYTMQWHATGFVFVHKQMPITKVNHKISITKCQSQYVNHNLSFTICQSKMSITICQSQNVNHNMSITIYQSQYVNEKCRSQYVNHNMSIKNVNHKKNITEENN